MGVSVRVWAWCELVCETCAKTIAGQMTRASRIPRAEMVKEARAHGWKISGGKSFCSVYCMKQGTEE